MLHLPETALVIEVGPRDGLQSLAQPLDVVEHPPAAEDVVGDVQDVVRLVVRPVGLEHLHRRVDDRRELQSVDDVDDPAETAVSDGAGALGEVVGDLGRRQSWATIGPGCLAQATVESSLSVAESSSNVALHLKGPLGCRGWLGNPLITRPFRCLVFSVRYIKV